MTVVIGCSVAECSASVRVKGKTVCTLSYFAKIIQGGQTKETCPAFGIEEGWEHSGSSISKPHILRTVRTMSFLKKTGTSQCVANFLVREQRSDSSYDFT